MTAQALGRYAFFGRDVISLLLILPLALPGIVTGIAFNIMFTSYLGGLGWTSLIVAHATFTIVVVYNNSVARLRRLAPNVEEASMDLGADAAPGPTGRSPSRCCAPRWLPALSWPSA